MSSENYRNLVYGNINQRGWQTPGYPQRLASQPNINILNFAEVASAEIAEAQLQNSPFSPLPAIGCISNRGCPGQSECASGRCQGKAITKPVAPQFNNGTIGAFAENFARCGKRAEGKLSDINGN